MVYDITNQKSFENLTVWKQDFLIKANPKDPDNFPFFVFGNKIDKKHERKVPQSKVDEWLHKNNDMPYEETSAMDGSNVELAFNRIASQLLRQVMSGSEPPQILNT